MSCPGAIAVRRDARPMPMPAAARKILKNREADAGWYKKIFADADSGADAGSNIFDPDSDKNAIGLASLRSQEPAGTAGKGNTNTVELFL